MKFSVLSSVVNKTQFEEQLSENVPLQKAILCQFIDIPTYQICIQRNFYQNLFDTQLLPYYNGIDFESHVVCSSIEAFVPICIIGVERNDSILTRLYVETILGKAFFSQYSIASQAVKKRLLLCSSLGEARQELEKFVDLYLKQIAFIAGDRVANDYFFHRKRIMLQIRMFYDLFEENVVENKNVSIPFLGKVSSMISQGLCENQTYEANCKIVDVQYSFKDITGKFKILYSTKPIIKRQRLIHETTVEKQLSLKKSLIEKWPFLFQIGSKLFKPKLPWFVPVIHNGKTYNIFDFVCHQMTLPIKNQTYVTFQLCVKQYEEYDCSTTMLKPTFNIVQATAIDKSQYRTIHYYSFDFLNI